MRERDNLGDPGVNWRIILKMIFRKWNGLYWIELAHHRDRWRGVVNAVMKLLVP
jgi:hypothetical protein